MGGRKCSRCQKEMRPTMFAPFEWEKSVEVRLCKICLPGSVPVKPRAARSRSRSRSKTPVKAVAADPTKASVSPVRSSTIRGRSASRSAAKSTSTPAKPTSNAPAKRTAVSPAKPTSAAKPISESKDAGDNKLYKLSPANTSDLVFYGMALVFPLLLFSLCYLLSNYQLDHIFFKILFLFLGTHIYGYIMSEILQTNKWFDAIEYISYSCILFWVYNNITNPTFAQTLIFGMAGLWVTRLTLFSSYRAIVSTGKGDRFEAMKNRSYNMFGWIMDGCLCFLQGLCLWIIADQSSKRKTPLAISAYSEELFHQNIGTYIGFGIFVIALVIESIADYQKMNNKKKSPIDTSWLGIVITAMGNLDGDAISWGSKIWLCVISMTAVISCKEGKYKCT